MSDDVSTDGREMIWTAAAAAIALAGTAGTLWLSLGMGLKACPLCLYQRAFLMSALGVLLVALPVGPAAWRIAGLLSLPAAAGGLTVAAFHVALEAAGKLECPAGVLGGGSAPQQSLALFAALVLVLLAGQLASRGERAARFGAAVAGLLLGALFAFGAIRSAPPTPPAPTQPYAQPPDVCRPPFRG